MKLKAHVLRKNPVDEKLKQEIKKNPIYFVLDNVLDTYNIGSIFRLADAVAAEKVFICGESEYPPNTRIHKAAIGTEAWVNWEHNPSTVDAINKLKTSNIQIVAVEQAPNSISISSLNAKLQFPIAIVVGHETHGISKEVLDMADIIAELPMFGVNTSLNVWGTAAIVAYKAIEALIFKPYTNRIKR